MRLSRKAGMAVGALTSQLEGSVRKVAAQLAEDAGKEHADEGDAREAYRLMILQIADKFQKLVPGGPHIVTASIEPGAMSSVTMKVVPEKGSQQNDNERAS